MREQNTCKNPNLSQTIRDASKSHPSTKGSLQPFAQVLNHHSNSLARSKYKNNVQNHESDNITHENYNET